MILASYLNCWRNHLSAFWIISFPSWRGAVSLTFPLRRGAVYGTTRSCLEFRWSFAVRECSIWYSSSSIRHLAHAPSLKCHFIRFFPSFWWICKGDLCFGTPDFATHIITCTITRLTNQLKLNYNIISYFLRFWHDEELYTLFEMTRSFLISQYLILEVSKYTDTGLYFD